jgi:hypothetical protein
MKPTSLKKVLATVCGLMITICMVSVYFPPFVPHRLAHAIIVGLLFGIPLSAAESRPSNVRAVVMPVVLLGFAILIITEDGFTLGLAIYTVASLVFLAAQWKYLTLPPQAFESGHPRQK